jgi:hypothetical protein
MMSGACSLAIVAPRRSRRRKLAAYQSLTLTVGQPGREDQDLRSADIFGAGTRRDAHHEDPDIRPAVGRHRLVNPGGPPRGAARPSRTSRHAAFPDSAFPESAFPESAFPDGACPDGVFPDRAFPDGALPDLGLPDLGLPDLAFPDGASGSSRRPEGRRPRHAAPPVGFSGRINSLMTGLATARALASGAHG